MSLRASLLCVRSINRERCTCAHFCTSHIYIFIYASLIPILLLFISGSNDFDHCALFGSGPAPSSCSLVHFFDCLCNVCAGFTVINCESGSESAYTTVLAASLSTGHMSNDLKFACDSHILCEVLAPTVHFVYQRKWRGALLMYSFFTYSELMSIRQICSAWKQAFDPIIYDPYDYYREFHLSDRHYIWIVHIFNVVYLKFKDDDPLDIWGYNNPSHDFCYCQHCRERGGPSLDQF